jgi:hypothetical protein
MQFRLLGPLEASLDGVELDLGSRKQRAVLALLLLNANRVIPNDRLSDRPRRPGRRSRSTSPRCGSPSGRAASLS